MSTGEVRDVFPDHIIFITLQKTEPIEKVLKPPIPWIFNTKLTNYQFYIPFCLNVYR